MNISRSKIPVRHAKSGTNVILNDNHFPELDNTRDMITTLRLDEWSKDDLSALGVLPNLVQLSVVGATHLKKVDLSNFPKLQTLTLRGVPELETVVFDEKLTSLDAITIAEFTGPIDLAYVEITPLTTVMLMGGESGDLAQLPKTVKEITCNHVQQVILPHAEQCPKLEVIDASHSYMQEVPDWLTYTNLRRINLHGLSQEYINGKSNAWPESLTHACLTRGWVLPKQVQEEQTANLNKRLILWG